MLSVYIFSLVLGGSFLLVSLLGDAFDAEAEVDAELSLDAGDAADALEAGEALDVSDALDASDAGDVTQSTHAVKIFSVRGLIYALFGFGAVGSLVSWLGQAGSMATFAAAVVGGLLTGGMVTVLFNWIRANSASNRQGDTGFVGLRGTVTLPVGRGSPGTVMVERGGRRVALRALPWEGAEGDSAAWRDVLVMEMEKGVAMVAPVEEDLRLEP